MNPYVIYQPPTMWDQLGNLIGFILFVVVIVVCVLAVVEAVNKP